MPPADREPVQYTWLKSDVRGQVPLLTCPKCKEPMDWDPEDGYGCDNDHVWFRRKDNKELELVT